MDKTILFLFLAGPEVRQFGHSGLITKLLDDDWRVFVAARIIDEDLALQLDKRVELIPLIQESLEPKFSRLQKLLDRAFDIRESTKGKKKWTYRPQKELSAEGKIRDRLFDLLARALSHFPKLYQLFLEYEQKLEAQQPSKVWLEILNGYNVDVVIVNAPRSVILHPALIAAKKMDIERILLYHSKKDISVNGRIIHKYSTIGVWNEWMKGEIIRQNLTIVDPGTVQITGCAHFDCVGRKDILIPESEFRRKIGANQNASLLLYPASVPWVIPEEEKYIQIIVNAIHNGDLPKDLQVIIRTNPMDLTHRFEERFGEDPKVIVQRADWRMEKDKGWNFQRYEDMVLYNSLLHYASLCVGIPSTITIEAAISRLPVINLGFDLPGPEPIRPMEAFWKADFYKAEVKHGAAVLAENEADLLEKINATLLSNKPEHEDYQSFLSEILGVPPHHAVEKYNELINRNYE